MKVYCAGWARTGSQSLKQALEILGYQTYGMTVALQNFWHLVRWVRLSSGKSVDLKSLLANYDAAVGVPCSFYVDEMQQAFPNAKVLICVREEQSWVRSFTCLFNLVNRISRFLFWIPRFRFMARLSQEWMKPFSETQSNKAKWVTIYRAKIENDIHNISSDKQLVYKITDGWVPLCEFLGESVPDLPFPHVNKSESEVRRVMIRILLKDLSYFALLIGAGYGLWRFAFQ